MRLSTYTKQPAEVKDYDVDYAPWLNPVGDTLDGVTAVITCLTDSEDTSLVCNEVLHTTTYCKLWIAGGTAGNRYKVTLQASTVEGRIDESELIFVVKDY